MDVFENGAKIGTMQTQTEGLYTIVTCKIEPSAAIRRLYLSYPYASQYLGIPDESGVLIRRIARKKMPKEFCALACEKPIAGYLPWCGIMDGVAVQCAYISPTEILLSADDAMHFPSWDLDKKLIDEKEMAVVPLNAQGMPQPREREATHETFDFDDFDTGVLPGLPADDFGGDTEADRPDL